MHPFRNKTALIAISAILGSLFPAGESRAASEKIVYSFPGGDGGAVPTAPLIVTSSGDIYGTTSLGGNQGGGGTLFAIPKNGAVTTFFSFGGGVSPQTISDPSGSIVMDKDGNFYGTSYVGGFVNGCTDGGCGTVWKVSTERNQSILYLFNVSDYGFSNPASGLVADASGNLYGATEIGGILFSVSKKTRDFSNLGVTGPVLSTLTVTPNGTIYGTSVSGGNGQGSVFTYSTTQQSGSGLYDFEGGSDGSAPEGSIVVDAQGYLYGTTSKGGSAGAGTLFKMTPSGAKTTLYSFKGGEDGNLPLGNLAIDASGNVYGVTNLGGSSKCGGTVGCGTVFEYTASGVKITLHEFTGSARSKVDGIYPQGGLTIDKHGHLFGTTALGGTSNNGTVFEITP